MTPRVSNIFWTAITWVVGLAIVIPITVALLTPVMEMMPHVSLPLPLPHIVALVAVMMLVGFLIKKGDLPSAVAIVILVATVWFILKDGTLSLHDIPVILLTAFFFAAWRGYLSRAVVTAAIIIGGLVFWLGVNNVTIAGRNLGDTLREATSGNWTLFDGRTSHEVIVPANGCIVENNTDPRYYFLGEPEDKERGYPVTFVKRRTQDRTWIPYQDGMRFVFIKWCGDGQSDQVMLVTKTRR